MPVLRDVFEAAGEDRLPDIQFLDIDHAAVEHEIVRSHMTRRSGPTAENLLRNMGTPYRKLASGGRS